MKGFINYRRPIHFDKALYDDEHYLTTYIIECGSRPFKHDLIKLIIMCFKEFLCRLPNMV